MLSNEAMPGIVKIGFSSKDPSKRAAEITKTEEGVPKHYSLEYDLLTIDPYAIEQATHTRLSNHHYGKEWFRIAAEDAISTIREIAQDALLLETFHKADRAKVATESHMRFLASQSKGAEKKSESRLICEFRLHQIGRAHV